MSGLFLTPHKWPPRQLLDTAKYFVSYVADQNISILSCMTSRPPKLAPFYLLEELLDARLSLSNVENRAGSGKLIPFCVSQAEYPCARGRRLPLE